MQAQQDKDAGLERHARASDKGMEPQMLGGERPMSMLSSKCDRLRDRTHELRAGVEE